MIAAKGRRQRFGRPNKQTLCATSQILPLCSALRYTPLVNLAQTKPVGLKAVFLASSDRSWPVARGFCRTREQGHLQSPLLPEVK
jgi:hypothetical protein